MFTSEEKKKKKKASFLAGPSIGEQKVFYRGNKCFFLACSSTWAKTKLIYQCFSPFLAFSFQTLKLFGYGANSLLHAGMMPHCVSPSILRPKKDSLFFPLETPQEEIKGRQEWRTYSIASCCSIRIMYTSQSFYVV